MIFRNKLYTILCALLLSCTLAPACSCLAINTPIVLADNDSPEYDDSNIKNPYPKLNDIFTTA